MSLWSRQKQQTPVSPSVAPPVHPTVEAAMQDMRDQAARLFAHHDAHMAQKDEAIQRLEAERQANIAHVSDTVSWFGDEVAKRTVVLFLVIGGIVAAMALYELRPADNLYARGEPGNLGFPMGLAG